MDDSPAAGPPTEPATSVEEPDTVDDFGEDDDFVGSRTPGWIFPVIAALVVVGFAIAVFVVLRSPGSSSAVGPEGVPIQKVPDLASRSSTVDGTPVNGITCRPTMGQSVKYHIHQLVTIFVDGEQKRLPAGVGITGPLWEQEIDGGTFLNNSAKGCVYWLHTHANDGVVHVESPVNRRFTLGDFFDVWNQPLSATQVGPAKGPVVAYLNGKRYADPRTIPLTDHGVIQLSVGKPVKPFEEQSFSVKNVCGDGTLSCSVATTTSKD